MTSPERSKSKLVPAVVVGCALATIGAIGLIRFNAEVQERDEALGEIMFERDYSDCIEDAEIYDPSRGTASDAGIFGVARFTLDAEEQGGGVLEFMVQEINDEYSLQPSASTRIILESLGCTPPASTE